MPSAPNGRLDGQPAHRLRDLLAVGGIGLLRGLREQHDRGGVLPRPVGRIFVVFRLVGIAPGRILRRRRKRLDVAVAGVNALRQVLDHGQRGVVGHVDREHLHLAEHRVDVGLVDIGGEIAAPQAGIQRLRLRLQDLGHDFGVIGLEQLWPGFADDLDVRREALQVQRELAGGIAAIGIVRRAGRPFLQALGFRDRRRVAAADDGIVNALARGAERVRDVLLGIGGQRRGFRAGVNAEHAEIARDFMHRERSRRCFAIEQQFAAIGVDEFARDAGGFLRLPLGIADHHFDLPAGQAAGGVDLLDFQHHGVARRGAELRDAAGQNGRHADLDGLGLRARHPWRRECHSTGAHQRQRRTAADARFAGSRHFPLPVGLAFPNSLPEIVSVSIASRISEQRG